MSKLVKTGQAFLGEVAEIIWEFRQKVPKSLNCENYCTNLLDSTAFIHTTAVQKFEMRKILSSRNDVIGAIDASKQIQRNRQI